MGVGALSTRPRPIAPTPPVHHVGSQHVLPPVQCRVALVEERVTKEQPHPLPRLDLQDGVRLDRSDGAVAAPAIRALTRSFIMRALS